MKPLSCSRALQAGLALWVAALAHPLPLRAQSPETPAEKTTAPSSNSSRPPGFSLGLPPQTTSPSFAPLPVGPTDNSRLPLLPLLPDSPPSSPESKGALGDLPDFELNTRRPDAPLPDGPNRTEEAALLRIHRIRYRETKAKALLLPDVQASLEATRKARSDREFRRALQAHYELLYGKMTSLQPSLAPLIQGLKQRAIEALHQSVSPDPSRDGRPPFSPLLSAPSAQALQP